MSAEARALIAVDTREREVLTVTGQVQGVGFRPFAWRLAHELGLTGSIANHGAGVRLALEGAPGALAQFRMRLEREAPAPCRLASHHGEAALGASRLVIEAAQAADQHTFLPLHDVAPCEHCLRELDDPTDRRYRYPFIACADCGPRLTVALRLPWTRAHTTMAAFPPCPDCAREHADPGDRRFHAELIACPACGPTLDWQGADGDAARGEAALQAAAATLAAGGIVALKGVGGFQLLCDAGDTAAIARLRHGKRRPRKPLAVLVASLAEAERLAELSGAERALLATSAAPIVLCRARGDNGLADPLHPGLADLGLMLPASPLHLLLARAVGRPLVCTSGNQSGEPLWWHDEEGRAALGRLADGVLGHDRAIALPCDDPVMRVMAGRAVTLRLGRGLAPQIVELASAMPPALALGGHMKNAVALARGRQALLGPHVGDLDHPATRARHEAVTAHLLALHELQPQQLAHDCHPDYATTAEARRRALPAHGVQHHHAHALACAAEHGYQGPLLAVCWDGTGFGADGTVWGGEWLAVDGATARRVAWLAPFRLIGGEAAIRDPRRVAIALLAAARCPPPWPALLEEDDALAVDRLARLADQALAGPLCSSAGRLLDGIAALCGRVARSAYDGEPAMRLEAAVPHDRTLPAVPDAARLRLTQAPHGLTLDWRGLVSHLVELRLQGAPIAGLAGLAHAALVDAVVAVAARQQAPTVALAGGCFQNRTLLEGAARALTAAGHRVLLPGRVPPNDGGLALGQLVAAGSA